VVTFHQTRQQLSPSDIQQVEQKIGISLPDDLQEHFLLHNGGQPNPRYFSIGDDWIGVQQFLPMNTADRNSGFEQTYEDLVLSTSEFPTGYIPFAIDDGGDYFLYCMKEDQFGKIFFNQSEFYDDPNRVLIFLSDSLSAFIGRLSNPI
jgi:hypothetical protein